MIEAFWNGSHAIRELVVTSNQNHQTIPIYISSKYYYPPASEASKGGSKLN